MKVNGLELFLDKIRAGAMPLGAAITFTDPAVTEVACASGLDFLWFDGEHGEFGRETAMLHLMAVKGTGVASLYRVPNCDHTEIKRIIDFAPAGVIIPMVLTAEDAARAVDACRYPIHGGSRGFGPRRGLNYGTGNAAEYLDASAHDPLVMIQLEHIEAARNLDAILEVPGIDAVIVGPFDFTMSMKKPGQFHDPEVMAVLDECCRKIRAKGILLGCYTECDFDIWKRRGVQFMAIKNDTNAMLSGFHAMMERARERVESVGVEELGVESWELGMVDGVRRALEANRAAYDALRENLRAGMTERDAYRIVGEAVDRVCGVESHEFIGDFVGGARSGSIEGPATDYAFKPGDAFILDLSVRRGSTWSDTCRTFFFGDPSARQRQVYETVLSAQGLAEGLVRAGVVAESVKEAVEAFLVSRGYGGKMPHHVGHIVGPKPYMKPAFELGDVSRMEVGAVCTLEPGLYFEGDFGVRVENDYLIGADGLANIFDYPLEMEYFTL